MGLGLVPCPPQKRQKATPESAQADPSSHCVLAQCRDFSGLVERSGYLPPSILVIAHLQAPDVPENDGDNWDINTVIIGYRSTMNLQVGLGVLWRGLRGMLGFTRLRFQGAFQGGFGNQRAQGLRIP